MTRLGRLGWKGVGRVKTPGADACSIARLDVGKIQFEAALYKERSLDIRKEK